ncbi:hypothetical protein SCBWM1_gp132 [Synechococcus phage S-CBWM1]|uniref:Uncharacterized protein n=1 Tax=Synechococcus phage S-CBWM1 TaxID=2053653 RepID=A0A3G1L3Q8_9CAUD|nr:hypothetical protein HOU61_gp065 [Synechococcus phage S-CBWM1]ATW62816.1 hypothetical protein SCBWM1_gp132 [Synechococcus phage S-CBWM1]
MAFSGIIPTVNVPAPLSGLGNQVLEVAVSPILGSQISNAVGIPEQDSFNLDSLPSSLMAAIPEYDLGGFEGLANGVLGQAVGSLFPGEGGGAESQRAYPGAGAEPEAQYGGFVYNSSTPVVFSINRAQAQAMLEGKQALGTQGATIPYGEIPSYASQTIGPESLFVQMDQIPGSVGSLASTGAAMKGYSDHFKGVASAQIASSGSFLSGNGALMDPAVLKPLTDGDFGAGTIPKQVAEGLGTGLRSPGNSFFSGSMESAFTEVGALAENSSFGVLPGIGSSAGVGDESGGWTFIIGPESIKWNTTSNPSRVEMYGTNSPPVMGGGKGMRDLELSGAIVEGFTRSKQVEDKISQLEFLMNYELSNSKPFVNVPVYTVTANEKIYGDGLNSSDGGFFVIKDINVEEQMRDFTGRATRAVVDISLIQVPAYQVESGVDQASESVTGAESTLQSSGDSYEAAVKRQEAEISAKQQAAQTAAGGGLPDGITANANLAPSRSAQFGKITWKRKDAAGRMVTMPAIILTEAESRGLATGKTSTEAVLRSRGKIGQ